MSNTQVDTPYASFNAVSSELSSNGGAWFPFNSATIIPHQSMGGAADLFQLTGVMNTRIVIPSDIAQIGDMIVSTFTFIACEVRMDGDIRDYGTLWGSVAIPFCPTMSDTLTRPDTLETFRSNPLSIGLGGEELLGKRTTVYLGKLQYSIRKVDQGIQSSSIAGSSVSTSNPTQATSAPTSTVASTTAIGGVGNGTQPVSGSSTITLANGGTTVIPVFLTTKNPQFVAASSASTDTHSPLLVSSKDGGVVRRAAIIGSIIGGILLLVIIINIVFFKLRRRERRAMDREAEKLGSSHHDDSQTIESSNDFNRSGRSNPLNNYDRYGTAMHDNSNFGNLVSAPGLPSSSERTPVPPPPSYISNIQPPHIQPSHNQPPHPTIDDSMQPIPPVTVSSPPPFVSSGPVDAVWLINYASGQQERRRESG